MLSVKKIAEEMRVLQKDFLRDFGVDDLWSNSKVYEILIASYLNHELVPGHSGTRDAKDSNNEYEYKHYKELSSNHSWTFNDYSETTIKKMIKENYTLIFAHINDKVFPPIMDWYYSIEGKEMGEYLTRYTKDLKNNRDMINVSKKQIEERTTNTMIKVNKSSSRYDYYLDKIFSLTRKLESITQVKNSLTSNKFWEIFIGSILNHQVNPEQGGREGSHDAYDSKGRSYEYKISKSYSWNFQDISDNVLNSYYDNYKIILAVVDKKNFKVSNIYAIDPNKVVPFLKEKLLQKIEKYKKLGKKLKRKQVSLSKGDLTKLCSENILF